MSLVVQGLLAAASSHSHHPPLHLRRPQPNVKVGKNGGRYADRSDPGMILLVKMQELSFYRQTGATRTATWGTLTGARLCGFEAWWARKATGEVYRPQKIWRLDPSEQKNYQFASIWTIRRANGRPKDGAVAYKETLGMGLRDARRKAAPSP